MPPKIMMDPTMGMDEEDMSDMAMNSNIVDKFLNLNYSKEFMADLPEKIRTRAQVLRVYLEDYKKLQEEMQAKEVALRRKYDELYAPVLHRRHEIINGAKVTEEEVLAGYPEDHKDLVPLEKGWEAEEEGCLESFWLTVLHHHVGISSIIEEQDEAILKHLTNITSRVVDEGYGSFEVTFTFAPNEHMEEEQVTATVIAKEGKTALTVSPITWKPGKNPTVHTVTKKQRAKRTGKVRTISCEKPCPSFFSIFKSHKKEGESSSSDDDEDDEEHDEDDEEEQQTRIFEVIHNCMVPGAVRYFTGEAPDGSSDVDDGDDMDMYNDDEEDEDEDDDEDDAPPRRGGRGGRGGRAF